MTAPSRVLTIREYLDRRLSAHGGVRELTELSEQIASQPLDETVRDLRDEIRWRPVGIDDQRRLHQLISSLYHGAGADMPLVNKLRAEVVVAFNAGRTAGPLTAEPLRDRRRG